MSTDRELLELAAAAAGLQVEGNPGAELQAQYPGGWASWNPLTDDGDALRLAVKLGMILDLSGSYIGEVRYYIGDEQISRRLAFDKEDAVDSIRRCIVRAAAAMAEGSAG